MTKKKTVAKEPKATGIATTIKQLHACITKDQNELAKLYKKAVAESTKKLATIKKLFAKAKKAVAQKVSNKKKAPKDYALAVNLSQSLKNEWAIIKSELAALKTGYKRFIAEQKVLKKMDKGLAKSAKTSKGKRKMTAAKKPRAATRVNDTTAATHSQNASDMLSDNTQ